MTTPAPEAARTRSPIRQLRLIVDVADLDDALAFYRDALGLVEQAAFSGSGDARVAILRAGEATLELANGAQRAMIDEVEVGRQVEAGLRVAFEVDNTDETVERLRDAGATLLGGPVVTPWQSRNARLDAPAGVQLTVFQELESLADRARRPGFGTQSDTASASGEGSSRTVLLTVGLWARAGREQELHTYEDQVLQRLPFHGGQVVLRMRPERPSEPTEVQLLRFNDEASYQSFLEDPQRLALAAQRSEAIESTTVQHLTRPGAAKDRGRHAPRTARRLRGPTPGPERLHDHGTAAGSRIPATSPRSPAMPRPVTVTVGVSHGIEKVFAFLDRMANHERFNDHLMRDWELTGPEAGVGSRARVTTRVMGFTDLVDIEVVEAAAPTRIVEINTARKAKRVGQGTYTLSRSAGGGTLITFEYRWLHAPPIDRLSAPLVRSYMRRSCSTAMRRLAAELDRAFTTQ